MADVKFRPLEERDRIRAGISADQVLGQTERICRSDAFDGQSNAQKVLRYLVTQALERRPVTAKEIALEALGKRDFNRYDSQPRQEVKTIREKLEEFYKTEAADDDIWLDIPKKQFDVFWRHSPKTKLGQTESSVWTLSSARSKLAQSDAEKGAETAQKFWPGLTSIFLVYCAEEFKAKLESGKLRLPDEVKMFFDIIGSRHVFLTSFNRSEVRIYPLKVWLEEWARGKNSEDGLDDISVLQYWGQSGEIDQKGVVSIHPKLLDALNLPYHRGFDCNVSFSPEGFVFFDAPEPLPHSTGKYHLYGLSYAQTEDTNVYYYILVPIAKEKAFERALAGKDPFSVESFGYILEWGIGDPPKGLKKRLLAAYAPLMKAKSPTRLSARRRKTTRFGN